MDARNSKAKLLERIAELELKLESVFDAGMDGIEYVGTANYASREAEARAKLNKAMYGCSQ